MLTNSDGATLSRIKQADGDTVWTNDVPLSPDSAERIPVQVAPNGDALITGTIGIGNPGHRALVYRYAAATGVLNWQFAGLAPVEVRDLTATSVVPGDSHVYVAGNTQVEGRPVAGFVSRILNASSVVSNERVLTIRMNDANGGSVGVSGVDLNCTDNCSRLFPVGSNLVLKAYPNPSRRFTGWSGGGCSGTGDCNVLLTDSTAVTANFVVRQILLRVNKSGNGQGRVTSSPLGIDCGASCSASFAADALPTLTPTAEPGAHFLNTRISCPPVSLSVSPTLYQCVHPDVNEIDVDFVFTSGDFSVSISSFTYGRVVSTPAGIDCPGACQYRFPAGTTVVLKAMPRANEEFLGWSQMLGSTACEQTTADTCTVSSNANVYGIFRLAPTTVNVAKSGAGSGRVISNPPGIDCGTTCNAVFSSGVSVSLNPIEDEGSVFMGFDGFTPSYFGTPLPIGLASNVNARFELASVVLPSAPRDVQIFPGDRQVTVLFNSPSSSGSSPITSYSLSCSLGLGTSSPEVMPLRVQNLENGSTYSCKLAAHNRFGRGTVVDVAVTPSASAPFVLSKVVSRKLHANGTNLAPHVIEIDRSRSVGGTVTIEPRAPTPAHTLLFRFSDRVNSTGTVSVVDAMGTQVGNPSLAINGNDIEVSLLGLPNGRKVQVTLSGVNNGLHATAAVGFLLGDVDGSGIVDGSDLAALRSKIGQIVAGENFLFDINLSNRVTSADLIAVKRRLSQALQ
jgi:hypothetical protein